MVYYQASNLYDQGDATTPVAELYIPSVVQAVSIYPNPAVGAIKVMFRNEPSSPTEWRYKISDLYGRTLQNGRLLDQTIPVDALREGSYLLQVFDDENYYSRKIVIAK